MSNEYTVTGLQISSFTVRATCSLCAVGKLTQSNIPKSTLQSIQSILGIVHFDACGPMEVNSRGLTRFFVTLIGNASRWTFVYPTASKSETVQRFKEFLALAECQTGCTLNVFETDGGSST